MLTITNEDNMVMMARYPDKYFDLAICDPPYGIGAVKNIGRRKKWKSYKKELHAKKEWDNNTPNDAYFYELFRVSKNQIIFGANYFELPPTKGILAWDKMCDNTDFSDFELAWTSFDKAAKIIRIPIQAESQKRIHPTQKPVKLYKQILETYAICKKCDNTGEYWSDATHPTHDNSKLITCSCLNISKILDTHLGSGSIAIACHDYGFDLTACELDKEYYNKAMQRINNHTLQTKLF